MRITRIQYETHDGKTVEFEIDPKDTQKFKEAMLEAAEHGDIGTMWVIPEPMSDEDAQEWIEWSAGV